MPLKTGAACMNPVVYAKVAASTLPFWLSADEHKYDDVHGEGFLAEARRERLLIST
jgi:hypothetical protein